MTTNKNNKEQFWITLFILLPVLVFGRLGAYFTDYTIFSILLTGLLGGMGGMLGGGVYRLVKQKSNTSKILGFVLMTIFCVIVLFVGLKYSK